ncbi:MAG TPA: hypothetical protein VMF08_12225 [Candidatus Sulfotelmatobacter sp.]|nr:hypothetical protein [Candidatus Sulfotelmatobacter sp.]
MPSTLSNNLKRPVVVAMVAVRMMKVSVNQIVNMVAMGNRRMPATWAMNMLRGVFGGGKSRSAFIGIGRINSNRVLIHVITVRMMQMTVVKIIYMPFMLDGGVPAAGGVDVGMVRMSGAGVFAHKCFRLLCLFVRSLLDKHPFPSPAWQEMFLQVTCI